ncbi:MAG: STAS/SEC14 domain-containing protein [Candidatus Omnitrophica bacterium]|nr:STAS/SEC14 domain-containing protein [Candidatus Omnitrophota bacterium]
MKIDAQRGIVYLQMDDPFDVNKGKELIDKMLDHPDFRKGMSTLWDIRGVDAASVTREHMREMRMFNLGREEKRGYGRMAILVDSDINFGLSRMYHVVGDLPHIEMSVFRELNEAEQWLDESPFWPVEDLTNRPEGSSNSSDP